MDADAEYCQHDDLMKLLKDRLEGKGDCVEIISSYEMLLRSMCDFVAQLLGDEGVGAVLDRSIQLASQDVPMLRQVQIVGGRFDFNDMHDYLVKLNCSALEVAESFTHLCVKFFDTLSDLAGEAITLPMLRYLQGRDW